MGSPASPQAQYRQRRMARLLSNAVRRVRSPRVPFRVGQVLIGDDPFNGRRLGTVAVIETPYVGLRIPGSARGHVVFYDYRQLRYPD
jgi:hypothetical protein